MTRLPVEQEQEQDSQAAEIRAECAAFLSRIELGDVRFTRCHGEVVDEAASAGADSVELKGQYRYAGSDLQCRWSLDLPIETRDRAFASIEVTVLETFAITDGDRPSPEALSLFMEQTALPIAMPYLREAIQSMGARLGIGPIVLGLSQDAGRPPKSAMVQGVRMHLADPLTRALGVGEV